MNKWDLIFVGASVSYALRALPFLILRRIAFEEGGSLSRFLNYAAYSVMGGIIYSALYGERFYRELEGHLGQVELLKFMAVAIAFVVAVSTRNLIKALLISLSSYAFLSWVM